MKLTQLGIVNFRPISDTGKIACAQGMNVFVGVNGAGKSSVLDAVKILLSWLVARIRNPRGAGISIKEDDITKRMPYALLTAQLDGKTNWQLYKQRASTRKDYSLATDLKELSELADKVAQGESPMPTIAYYDVNRAIVDIPRRKGKWQESAVPEFGNLIDRDVNFRRFFEWFREREDIENAAYRQAEGKNWQEDRQLKAVRDAIATVLPGYSNLRVCRHPLAFVMEKGDKTFNFNTLSDGEKCYITLVADIARRLAMTNLNMPNPLEGEGIILIDEIDLHLHPNWQMSVLPALRKTFPNCQFFITTHSPFVVANVRNGKEDSIYTIRDGELAEVGDETAYGAAVDEILTSSLFDVPTLRNPEVEAHWSTIWDLAKAGDFSSSEYKRELQWLTDVLHPDDRVFSQLKMQELLWQKQHHETN